MRPEPLPEPRPTGPQAGASSWPKPRQPPRHDARTLTAGGSQAEIRLDGVRYLLRITRQGKLILTK